MHGQSDTAADGSAPEIVWREQPIMKTTKLNFTVPEDIAETLRARISRRKRSAFVAAALLGKLKELEQEQLVQELKEGYQATAVEDEGINREWQSATLQGWK